MSNLVSQKSFLSSYCVQSYLLLDYVISPFDDCDPGRGSYDSVGNQNTVMYLDSRTGTKTTGWKQSEGRSKILGKGAIFLAVTNTFVVFLTGYGQL